MARWILFLCMLASSTLYSDLKVLVFAGSTREGSYNKQLSKEAAKVAKELGAQVTWVDLKDFPMPFYNEDLEKNSGMPQEAKRLRRLMLANDYIIIASPEYNGSFSALLKNTLDWASRNEEGKPSKEAFQGKRFAIMSASPGRKGGADGLKHLQEVIEDVKGIVIARQLSVPQAYQNLDSVEHFENSPYYQQLQEQIKELLNKE